MWVKALIDRIPKPCVDNHQRIECIRAIRSTLSVSFDDAVEYESKAYAYSNGTYTIYLTFIGQVIRRRMGLGDFEAYCAAGDMSHAKLQDRNVAYDEAMRTITDTKFECDIVTSTRQCPKCRRRDIGTVAKQTRSADEGMTAKYICYNPSCGHVFSAN